MRIGEWTVDPERNELQRRDASVRLEPKVVEVLVYLAKKQGRVVSREELLSTVWPGVVVGDDALTQAVIKLRRALGDDAHKPTYIETISKRGYRLIAAVADDVAPAAEPPAPALRSRTALALVVGGFVVSLALGLLVTHLQIRMPWPIGADTRGAASSSAPIIAVLPLANLSGDASREYFSDGVTEDIIAALGRFTALRVMSKGAVQEFKAKAPSLETLRDQLGARYVVRGSVRENGGRVRVAIELSDTGKGVVLWSHAFDGAGAEVFDIQDRIVQSIVRALHVKLTQLEMDRAFRKPTESLEAYDLVLRARDLVYRRDRRANREARELLARAAALSPDYGDIYLVLADAEIARSLFGWVEDPAEPMRRAEDLVNKVLASSDTRLHARGHFLMSRVHSNMARPQLALMHAEKALAANPGDCDFLYWHGVTLLYAGNLEQGVAAMEEAQKLDPLLTDGNGVNLITGYYILGRYRDAVTLANQFIARYPRDVSAHALRAASFAQLGEPEKARAASADVRRLNPYYNVEFTGLRFASPAHRDRLKEGLRKAGL